MALSKGDLILFIGDSITDAGRSREDGTDLGPGYPRMVASALSVLRPERALRFLNRGISGDRTVDVYNRLDADCISHRPAMVSILLGINDVWHRKHGRGLADEEMEEQYRKILVEIRRALGDIPILMLEPFLMPDEGADLPRGEVDSILPIIRNLAAEFDATFVPLDAPLLKACEALPPHTVTQDGVHPTKEGHGIIAKHWIDAGMPLI